MDFFLLQSNYTPIKKRKKKKKKRLGKKGRKTKVFGPNKERDNTFYTVLIVYQNRKFRKGFTTCLILK